MKIVLKTASHLFGMAFISFCFAVAAHGQGRNDLLISAHAGGVNFVSGDVAFKRAGESARRQLLLKDDLKSGDALTTGGRGQVEVLLNPGSYLRLGGDSEFELTDNSLDKLRLKLVKGSAVIEATGYGDLGPLMVVETPRSRVSIVRGGIYRLNVSAGGGTEVAVHKGRVLVGGAEAVLVKEGKLARASSDGVEVVKFEKKDRDDLDLWSRERGRELAKVNQKLSVRNVNALLANSNYDYLMSAQNRYGFTGVWVWDASRGCNTFLPFVYGWRSPYGHFYDHQLVASFGAQCASCPRTLRPVVISGRYPTMPPSTDSPGGMRPVHGGMNPTPGVGDFSRPAERSPVDRSPGIDRPGRRKPEITSRDQ